MAPELPSGPDPTLYLYTSLTAGSSHIITATSRLETILKANKIAFRAIDCATDEKARTLWSRRSKGRKIPGLVKYGQVIGDLEAVEEWNEYGEIKENIDSVSDILGDTPMTDTPMPPPSPITLRDPLAKTSEPPSRSSSETRHISISDPKDKDGSGSPASSVKNLKEDTPLSMAMRQAGAEAAAKAGQRKASTVTSSKSSSTAGTTPVERDSTDTPSSAFATKMSADAEEPADATEITAAKTPAQLASEGAKKTSVDKIAERTSSENLSPLAAESDAKSTEEQMLEARRSSSIAKVPSRLAQETTVEDLKSPAPEQAVTSETNLSGRPSVADIPPLHHRGSSVTEASKEEIREIEQRNAIKEEAEDDSDKDEDISAKTPATKSTIGATDEAEAEVMKGSNPQDQKAKDEDAAGISAAAALFLSPSHDPNTNRLSADSASVYSFFDSTFSPAPLFSGSQNLDLDLNLSFIQGFGQADARISTSTARTNITNLISPGYLINGSAHGETPRQSEDTQPSVRAPILQQELPRREILPSMPLIAPLRTPARRQVSEPLLTSTSNRVSTPTSVPLPLKIRKSPTNPSASSPSASQAQPSHSQPLLQTQPSPINQSQAQPQTLSPNQPQASTSTLTSPTSPSPSSIVNSPTSPSSTTTPTSTSSTSRSLRFKKSLRSLRSKKSTQRLVGGPSSPAEENPPNLPPQRQLKDLPRSMSDTFVVAGPRSGVKREKSGVKNLLCF